MNNKKFIIYSDIDCTINNLIRYIIPIYNLTYNDNLTYEQIIDYDITKFIKPECKNFFKEFVTPKIINKLTLEKGCNKILKWVNNQTWIEFKFATAGNIYGLEARHEFNEYNFDWYHEDQLWRITHKQSLEDGDLLIDDCFANLKNAKYSGILIEKSWNRYIDIKGLDIIRVDKWDDRIIEFIKELAIRKGIKIN